MTISITWWGHATATIEIGGLRVLTDPVLTHRLAHLRRIGGPIPAPSAALADIVLISHLHADHLHIAAGGTGLGVGRDPRGPGPPPSLGCWTSSRRST